MNSHEEASLIIDGGHLAHAMGSVTIKCAKKYNMNPKDIHVNIDMLLPEIEKQLGLKFNLYQQFFYQGTTNGQPNDFHKRLRRNNITIGIHEMKIQHGKPVNKETTIMDPTEVALVSTFMNSQKWLIGICCLLLLAPIYTILKMVVIACVAYIEVYHKVSFFDICKIVDNTNPYSQKASIWVEQGVDVQIATKIIECAHGINGHSKSKVCIITGDSDLKSAFVCASHATYEGGNIIVLSESNCLATCLEPYLNDNKQVTLESIMEACVTSYTNEFLIMPRAIPPAPALIPRNLINQTTIEMPRAPPRTPIQKKVISHSVVVAETPKLPKKNIVSKIVESQFMPNISYPIKQDSSTVAMVDDQLSLEVALKLHKFIATKCGNKPFFTIEMSQFYNDGNELLKPFVQKVKVKSICMTWNELLITRGSQILLADSERSQNLVNSYFAVMDPPSKSQKQDYYRNEPLRDSYRNEPPQNSYQTGKSNDSDDTELLMRQLSVVWDGTIPIRAFLKDKKQILELLNLSVSETLISIKNCFPNEEPFQTCFLNFESKYINTNYRSLSKLCKEILLAVEEPSFPNLTEIIDNRMIIEAQYTVTEVEEITNEVEVEEITNEMEAEAEVIMGEMVAEAEVIMGEMVAEVEVVTGEMVAEVEGITGEVGAIMDDMVEFVGNNNSVTTSGGFFRGSWAASTNTQLTIN
jgi:hypothetical protein